MAEEAKYYKDFRCLHCTNTATMKAVARYSQVRSYSDDPSGHEWDFGDVYELLLCPACEKIMLQKGTFHSEFPEEWEPIVLYPAPSQAVDGLPGPVEKAYKAALAVRSVDANAFAVLLRRLLEIVCNDRGAAGRTLNDKLRALAEAGTIPPQLVEIANGLRQFGNIGAHAGGVDLSDREVPVLEALCRAILEYVYGAPQLIAIAQRTLDELKTPGPAMPAAHKH
jgi:hypothetical protein